MKVRSNQKMLGLTNKNKGMTLPETLLVLAVGAAVAVVGYAGYKTATGDVGGAALAQDTVTMIAKIKQTWGSTGNFTSLSAANLNNAGLLSNSSYKYDGTNIVDGLGNTATIDGATTKFAMLLGPYSKDDCARIAPQLVSAAYNINVGDAAALTGGNAGTVTGGSAFKAGTTTTQANMLTGCGGTNTAPKIAIEVR
ncbi:prepilin-type N-terminal cleavage/methylation domain-containing protein [Noviherbaspirillum galbum]|uniref:Prepilin-type N-terminal cleavage/methylation domain-containing protein n=1 Tax=Noviherbaspirillum galbum TaxID=2709383 RepID=A0A6B3SRP5_9BURK|nr:prepilin-type N-terminal cleavage/methylation domain-containing protein [Noviherbaspirillum galbum]NEX63364.1 prepilin-type N-terminal cleavage/methylation domain-containing protein [Noviherbaspirillum galbum]